MTVLDTFNGLFDRTILDEVLTAAQRRKDDIKTRDDRCEDEIEDDDGMYLDQIDVKKVEQRDDVGKLSTRIRYAANAKTRNDFDERMTEYANACMSERVMDTNLHELYLLWNTVTKRAYVGVNQQAYKNKGKKLIIHSSEARLVQHYADAVSKPNRCRLLNEALRTYGPSEFVLVVLRYNIPNDEIDKAEIDAIKELGAHESLGGMNLRWGGHNGQLSEETKALMSAMRSGVRHWSWNKPVSEHTKQAIAARNREKAESKRMDHDGVTRMRKGIMAYKEKSRIGYSVVGAVYVDDEKNEYVAAPRRFTVLRKLTSDDVMRALIQDAVDFRDAWRTCGPAMRVCGKPVKCATPRMRNQHVLLRRMESLS
jgi:hypothetical protein